MSYICIVTAFTQIGQFKNVIFEAFQVSKGLMSTAHDNQYTSTDHNLMKYPVSIYQNSDTLFWT